MKTDQSAERETPSSRRTRLALAVVILLLTSSSLARGKSLSREEHDEVTAQALAFAESYRATLEAGEPEAVRGMFVDDGRFAWFTDGKKRYSAPDEVVEALEGLAASGMKLTTQFSNLEGTPLTRDLAAVSINFQTEGSSRNGATFRYGGVITMLLERSPDGRWQVVQGHTSTPGGPP